MHDENSTSIIYPKIEWIAVEKTVYYLEYIKSKNIIFEIFICSGKGISKNMNELYIPLNEIYLIDN